MNTVIYKAAMLRPYNEIYFVLWDEVKKRVSLQTLIGNHSKMIKVCLRNCGHYEYC